MPVTLILVALNQQSGPHPKALVGLLAASSIGWVVWLVVRPWRRELPGGSTVALLLLMGIAATGGTATMIDGPGWAANFAAGAVVEAGLTLRPRGTAIVTMLAGVGLAVGSLLLGSSAWGLFGKLQTQYYFVFYLALFGVLALAALARALDREQLV
ncbi:MAG: hypothetical protein ACREN7_05020, partial [Candidatus Dormibacteria bacterium]